MESYSTKNPKFRVLAPLPTIRLFQGRQMSQKARHDNRVHSQLTWRAFDHASFAIMQVSTLALKCDEQFIYSLLEKKQIAN